MHTRPEGPRGEGSRDAYRRAPSGMDKTGDAGAGASTVEFVSISSFSSLYFHLWYKEIPEYDIVISFKIWWILHISGGTGTEIHYLCWEGWEDNVGAEEIVTNTNCTGSRM